MKTISIKDITNMAKGICKVVDNLEKHDGRRKYGLNDKTIEQRAGDMNLDKYELKDQLEKLQVLLLDEKQYQKEIVKYL